MGSYRNLTQRRGRAARTRIRMMLATLDWKTLGFILYNTTYNPPDRVEKGVKMGFQWARRAFHSPHCDQPGWMEGHPGRAVPGMLPPALFWET